MLLGLVERASGTIRTKSLRGCVIPGSSATVLEIWREGEYILVHLLSTLETCGEVRNTAVEGDHESSDNYFDLEAMLSIR